MHDVIIKDEEFEFAQTTVHMACHKIDKLVEDYLALLEKTLIEGVTDGETYKALVTYKSYAQKLRGIGDLFSAHHNTANSTFLKLVEEKDTYLYED